MNNKQKSALNDLQEAMRVNPGANIEQCMQGVLGAMQSISDIMFAVEFECGSCCKTVSAELDEADFVFLGSILLIIGDLRLKECSSKKRQEEIFLIAIPLDKISSFEVFERSCYCPMTEA